jgi:hypothetical protein
VMNEFLTQIDRQLAITAKRATMARERTGPALQVLTANLRNRRIEAFRRHHQALRDVIQRALARPDGTADPRVVQAIAAEWTAPDWTQYRLPIDDTPTPRLCRIGLLRDHLKVGDDETVGFQVPAMIPFLGVGHLSLIAGAVGQRRACAAISSMLLRLLLTTTPGSLRIHLVDQTPGRAAFRELEGLTAPLVCRGISANGNDDIDAMFARLADRKSGTDPPGFDVLAVAGFPRGFTTKRARKLNELIFRGVQNRVHVAVVADGSAGKASEGDIATIARRTLTIAHRPGHEFQLPGASLGRATLVLDALPRSRPRWLDSRIEDLQTAVGAYTRPPVRLAEFKPTRCWSGTSTTGLSAPLGRHADGTPFTLKLAEPGPGHIHVSCPGDRGAAVALNSLVLTLAWRYSPRDLEVQLLAFGESSGPRGLREIPHASILGHACERELGIDLLVRLDQRIRQRTGPTPRVLAVLEGYTSLLAGGDELARRASRLLHRVAARGPRAGIHLVLVDHTERGERGLLTSLRKKSAWLTLDLGERHSTTPPGVKNRSLPTMPGFCEVRVDDAPDHPGEAQHAQLAFLPQTEVAAAVAELANRAQEEGSTATRYEYDGRRPVAPEHEPIVQAWITDSASKATGVEAPLRTFVGGQVDLAPSHVAVGFPRGDGGHLLVVGKDDDDHGATDAAFGVVGAVCATAALQLPRDKIRFWIVDMSLEMDESLPWHLLTRLQHSPVVEGPDQLIRRIEEIGKEIDSRVSKPAQADERLFVVLYGLQHVQFLNVMSPVRSPEAQKLEYLLLAGPHHGVHLVLQVDSDRALDEKFPRRWQETFATRIAVPEGGGERGRPNPWGYIEQPDPPVPPRKFRTYGRQLRRWLESLS